MGRVREWGLILRFGCSDRRFGAIEKVAPTVSSLNHLGRCLKFLWICGPRRYEVCPSQAIKSKIDCSFTMQSLLVIDKLDVLSTLIAQSSIKVGFSALEFARVRTKRFCLRKSRNISITVAVVRNLRNVMKSSPIPLRRLEYYYYWVLMTASSKPHIFILFNRALN